VAALLRQGIVDGYAQYPTIDHNKSKAVGGLISVLAVNRRFHGEEPRRRAAPGRRLRRRAQDRARPIARRWSKISEKAGLPEPWPRVIRITSDHAAAGTDPAHLDSLSATAVARSLSTST